VSSFFRFAFRPSATLVRAAVIFLSKKKPGDLHGLFTFPAEELGPQICLLQQIERVITVNCCGNSLTYTLFAIFHLMKLIINTPRFLKNKGAVAAVFILVGLVCVGIIVFLARNFQRRRRHEAFDRELQEATRQAAATSTGPFFDDDDDGPYKNSHGAIQASMYGSAERQFSDASHGTQGTHGTYSQPPMAVDSYGMREIGHPPGPGDMYSSDPYAAGAAGIGVVRARSMRADGRQPDFASVLKDGNGPYPAFAIPNPVHMPGGGADPYASVARRGSTGYSQHPYAQQQHAAPVRQKSIDGVGQQNHANGYGPGHAVPNNRYSVVNEETEDAYGGVEDGADDNYPNPHMEPPLSNPHLSQASYANGSAHNDAGEPRRVLKVRIYCFLSFFY